MRSGSSLKRSQKAELLERVRRLSGIERLDLETVDFLAHASTPKSPLTKFAIVIGDLTTPANRKAQVRNYLDAYTCCPPAIFLVLISVIQIVIFALYGDSPDIASALEFHGPLRYQVYRYISYIFVHSSAAHLTGNLIVQLCCVPCEVVDHWRVWIIYLTSAVSASACYYVFFPFGHLVGASAAVFSLVAINLAELIMNWSEMPLRFFRLLLYGSYVAIHIVSAITSLVQGDSSAMAAEVSHLAGLVTGILLGVILVKNLKIERHEEIIRTICIFSFIALAGVLLGLNACCFQT